MSALRTEDDAPRGFVTMAEYRKLARHCEQLEEQLAAVQIDRRADDEGEAIMLLRIRAGITPQAAQIVLHLVRSRRSTVAARELRVLIGAPDPKSARVHHVSVVVCKLNCCINERGGPMRTVAGLPGQEGGYRLTDDGRAWLLDRVPEVFSQRGASK